MRLLNKIKKRNTLIKKHLSSFQKIKSEKFFFTLFYKHFCPPKEKNTNESKIITP